MQVSVLFNEPKLLKCRSRVFASTVVGCFSALQRAEIAEIEAHLVDANIYDTSFSALQRAEIAEI